MTQSSPRAHILVVEDDENLGLALRDNLEDEGYDVALARSGGDALRRARETPADLIILDLMLPDTDGYAVCRELRAAGSRAMILMLTARSLEEDLVRGFEVGADDYLTKPYRLRELLLRVRALLRRGGRAPARRAEFAGFRLDHDARRLTGPEGQAIDLTRTEFDLLACFLRERGRALSRAHLLAEVWGRDVVLDERTVDNFVSSLKKKLRWHERGGFRIRTVRGVGYRMELDDG